MRISHCMRAGRWREAGQRCIRWMDRKGQMRECRPMARETRDRKPGLRLMAKETRDRMPGRRLMAKETRGREWGLRLMAKETRDRMPGRRPMARGVKGRKPGRRPMAQGRGRKPGRRPTALEARDRIWECRRMAQGIMDRIWQRRQAGPVMDGAQRLIPGMVIAGLGSSREAITGCRAAGLGIRTDRTLIRILSRAVLSRRWNCQ